MLMLTAAWPRSTHRYENSLERHQQSRLPALPVVLGVLAEDPPLRHAHLTWLFQYHLVSVSKSLEPWQLESPSHAWCPPSVTYVPWTISSYSACSVPDSDLSTLHVSTHGNPYRDPRRLESSSPFQRWRNWGTGHIYFTVWHFVLEHRMKCQTVK